MRKAVRMNLMTQAMAIWPWPAAFLTTEARAFLGYDFITENSNSSIELSISNDGQVALGGWVKFSF
jgi:hypothetical protein